MHHALHLLDLLVVLHEAVSELLAQLGQALLFRHLMSGHEFTFDFCEELLIRIVQSIRGGRVQLQQLLIVVLLRHHVLVTEHR